MNRVPNERRRALRRFVGFGGAALGLPVSVRAAPAPPALAAGGIAAPAPVRGQGYRLVQNWDFANEIRDAEQLRSQFFTRYVYEGGTLDTLNDEWQRYRDHDNHVFEDGALALVARAPQGLARGRIESGMLRSRWAGRGGYFECRLQAPAGRGLWYGFWLNPQDARWPPEIDVVEIVDNGRDGTRNSFHFLHSGAPGELPVASSLLDTHKSYRPGFDYADGFHTFAVEWTPQRVRHFVDDVLVVDREFQWVHRDGSDGGAAHVLVNLAVGGQWPGPPLATSLPARLRVAHIRVWQQ